jgi:hypothetical protein
MVNCSLNPWMSLGGAEYLYNLTVQNQLGQSCDHFKLICLHSKSQQHLG